VILSTATIHEAYHPVGQLACLIMVMRSVCQQQRLQCFSHFSRFSSRTHRVLRLQLLNKIITA
jgi:hypothetical protein